jgi:DNA-binding response OmpR family regulator
MSQFIWALVIVSVGTALKPFRFAVLLARIRTQLRQHEASEDAIPR